MTLNSTLNTRKWKRIKGKSNFVLWELMLTAIYIKGYLCVLFNSKHFTRTYICRCSIFFFHYFLLLAVFSIRSYFMFENGIDSVFSFMLYIISIENEDNLKLYMFSIVFYGQTTFRNLIKMYFHDTV